MKEKNIDKSTSRINLSMNTTPRKVKQESRLRRSLSLTNTNRSNATELDAHLNGTASPSINYYLNEDGAFIENQHLEPGGIGGGGGENPSQTKNGPYNHLFLSQNQPLPSQQQQQQLGSPPPYRAPPALGNNNNSGPFPSSTTTTIPFFPYDLPNSVPDLSSSPYQTHSSKFPIREVIFSKESGTEPHPQSKIPNLSAYHKIQNRKLTTKQIAWTDERKAFTLDSRTGKDFQERLLSKPTITRRNSLDLEKFLKVFNEEQSFLMASMQGGRLNNMEGVDNPALELGTISHSHSHSHNNSSSLYSSNNSNSKMSGYFPDSQSLSLSSSNTDSTMDTVIYKGATPSPSIRDWQRSIDSNLERDFNHRGENNNSFRDTSVFVDSRSYQMQQTSSYQPLQFNGPGGQNGGVGGGMAGVNGHGNNFAIEYHRSSAQQQQQQGLSVQSIPLSSQQQQQQQTSSNNNNHMNSNSSNSTHHNHHSSNGNMSSSNGMSVSNLNVIRAGNNSNNNSSGSTPNGMPPMSPSSQQQQSYSSNPQLSKSPLLTQKQFSPVTSSSAAAAADLNHMLQHQHNESTKVTKDSSKLFHTKTYNHIKDMISSRFGNNASASGHSGGGGHSKSVNNNNAASATATSSSSNNNNNNAVASNDGNKSSASINGPLNNSSNNNSANNTIMNSYNHTLDPSPYGGGGGPNSPNYGLHHHSSSTQQQQQNLSSSSYTGVYYASPPTQSPSSSSSYTQQQLVNGGHHHGGHHVAGMSQLMNGGPPNSYRSPPLNDRKNVNTSFRKAIQKSTQKSNLAEDSVPQMRPIMETSAATAASSSSTSMQNNRDLYRSTAAQYNSISGGDQVVHQHYQQQQQQQLQLSSSVGGIGIHTERAQRALDILCETSGTGQAGQFQRSGSGPIIHPHHQQQQACNSNNNRASIQQQFGTGTVVESRSQNPSSSLSVQQQQQQQNVDNLNSRHKFSVKGGLGSPPSTSSTSGLTVLGAGGYSKSSKGGITNEAFQGNDEYNETPPPVPTSQQPGLSQHQQDINTVGLPVLAEKRENGDGSSGTMETSSKLLMEPGLGSGGGGGSMQSEQLKQITTDLQNLAMAVSAEHQSSSSECENKGSQRVGSGQSHTTTDSGHGTVLLAKSPLHSSDPSETLDALIEQRQKFNENIVDSISSGNDSEWVDIDIEPEIRKILEMERASKAAAGKLNSRKQGLPVQTCLQLSSSSNLQVNHPSVSLNHGQNSSGLQANQGSHAQSYNHNGSSRLPSSSHHPSLGGGHIEILSDLTKSPPLVSKKSPALSPKLPKKFDLSTYNKKGSEAIAGTSQQAVAAAMAAAAASKSKSPRLPTNLHRSNSNSGSGQNQRLNAWSSRQRLSNEVKGKSASSSRKDLLSQHKPGKLTRNAMSQILYSLHDDNGDITSTTTGLDLESMLDGPTENTSDDDDLSTTIDTTDAHAIRRQLESLETMYTEVLKVLGGRKYSANRYPSSDLRNAKRRPYGSMSSLPSSVSSRPFREKKKVDDKKKVKDLKSINRRFQRLESHVVTLARSVAHLSSEMRTQHLMVQEMESIRNEMSQLRSQVIKASMQNHGTAAGGGFARVASGRNGAMPHVNSTDWTSFRNALPSLTNPSRVRKLTKFFGDEPPLIRIFLKKLGYEKYASAFEQERIGIMELPYLTEERLNKMGIPMGPRLRILQEAHTCLKSHGNHDGGHQYHNNHTTGNLSVYVV